VSPAPTQVTSRTPTPSAAETYDGRKEEANRGHSVGPAGPSSPSPATKMGSRVERTKENDNSNAPSRPSIPPSAASAPAGRLPRLLPHDTSQFTETYVPTAAVPTSSTSLAELAHLLRLQGYQEQRHTHARVRLHRWLVSSALSARLVHCGELAHRALIDNFKADDKMSFAQLYNALHDVRNSCDATRRHALLEPDLELKRTKLSKAERPFQDFSTFIHYIPQKTRDDLLAFISELRTNPDFLASRISSFSQQELASLVSYRPIPDIADSVMSAQARRQGPNALSKSSSHMSSAVGRLLSFQRHDPLSALIHTIFANSSGPDSAEDLRRTDMWATTCARLVIENKPGAEKFIKVVLDAWAGMREWPGKANLEMCLMQALEEGQFLLDKGEEDASKPRSQLELRVTPKEKIREDEFVEKWAKRIYDCVDDDPSAGGLPDGFLEMGHAILRKLEEHKSKRTSFQYFLVNHWFFMSYLVYIISYPESQNMFNNHHVSEPARTRILKNVAAHIRKQVLDAHFS
ncbi:hypothetical protein LTS18_008706, partial [Coniosporium uncinatum]